MRPAQSGDDMRKWLNIVGAIFALAAAFFWFLSAWGKIPTLTTYWGAMPEDAPFFVALKFSAKMNNWAAALSAASALCVGVSLFLE
jgi:hypothetical protein